MIWHIDSEGIRTMMWTFIISMIALGILMTFMLIHFDLFRLEDDEDSDEETMKEFKDNISDYGTLNTDERCIVSEALHDRLQSIRLGNVSDFIVDVNGNTITCYSESARVKLDFRKDTDKLVNTYTVFL